MKTTLLHTWTILGLQEDCLTPATQDYTLNLTLTHTIAPPANGMVCRFQSDLGSWDCAQTSTTVTTVTREGISSLSDWAVGI